MLLLALLVAADLASQKLPLPAPAPVYTDYLAADGARIWVPAGNTGKVFVLDGGAFKSIDGFPTRMGKRDRLMGPSSVSIGEGTAFVGNRGDSKICAFDAATLARKNCSAELSSMPDGTFYVAATKEVWVTTPRESSLQILDAATLKVTGKIELPGEPEGYAVGAGTVYTNLEDKDRTLAIDAKARKISSTWEPGCGSDGPRGLAVDTARGLLFVACTDAVQALDLKTGAKKGRVETGKGVDNIDYVPARKQVYAAAGQAERFTLIDAADDGSLKIAGTAPLPKSVRVVVAAPDGKGYGSDSAGGQLVVISPPAGK